MSRAKPSSSPAPAKIVRCAICTRKSTEDGLEQEFNSLDAQRDGAEAFILSQKSEGWSCLPDRYDDGGYSGGSIDRPAMARLLADIAAGKIDCVVVYKVDRLSRSLMDFSRVMETFDRHHVSFVSVTQQFNTTHSMGRLTLNILLSFAQFEREIIGERIRDKIAAQRRRGKWTGGAAVLGYDVDRSGPSPKLVVNADEASRVRTIFDLYLEHGSLLPVVQELASRGWRTKVRVTVDGRSLGGVPFDKCGLYALLTNPLYIGKVRHKQECFDGEHEALLDPARYAKVQATLAQNGRGGGVEARNRHGALLRRLLYCKTCGQAMGHTFTAKRGRHYRYYTCVRVMKSGRAACPTPSLPAAEVERVVVDQVRCIGRDAGLLAEVLSAARAQVDGEAATLSKQREETMRELARHHAEIRRLVGRPSSARLVELHGLVERAERRLPEIDAHLARLDRERVNDADVRVAFADFGNVWSQLSPKEQARLLALLVVRVEYDSGAGTVAVTFHATGIKTLSKRNLEEAA